MMFSLEALNRHRESAVAAERAAQVLIRETASTRAENFRYAARRWYDADEYEFSIRDYELSLLEPDLEVTNYKIAIDFFNIGMNYYGLHRWRKAQRKFRVARKYFDLDNDLNNIKLCDEYLDEILESIEDDSWL